MRRNPLIANAWDRRYRVVWGEPGNERTWEIRGPLTIRVVMPDGREEDVALFAGTLQIKPAD